MAEVIDLKSRRGKEQRKLEGRARRRAEAVASALSCGSCPRRCAHCGMNLEQLIPPPREAPYSLCEVCHGELVAYLRRKEGLVDEDAFWHTEQWARRWQTWLEFMEANDAFRRSPAFLKLLEEHLD